MTTTPSDAPPSCRTRWRRALAASACLVVAFGTLPAVAAPDPALRAVVNSPARNPAFVKRDRFRHPAQELTFFGLTPNQTVVEIWPSGGYWTEILAPYLHDHGTYYAALPGALKPGSPFARMLAAKPDVYGRVKITQAIGTSDIAPAGTADLVVTFRNLHNWMKAGDADAMLASFYRALKPGGILGIEDHRGHRQVAQDPKAEDGYVNQDTAIALAKKAGFELVGTSEMDANPKDTAQWPQGVWTLPPTFAMGAKDHDKYAAIGEADNFVLKFRKPN